MQLPQIPEIKTHLLSQTLEVFSQIPIRPTDMSWHREVREELKQRTKGKGVSGNSLRHAVARGLLLYDYAMRNKETLIRMGHLAGQLPNVQFLPSLLAAGARAKATQNGLDEADMHFILEKIAEMSQGLAQVGK